MAYSDVVLADSPVIYYKLDEVSGAITNYGSAGGTGTAGTGITRSVAGIPAGGNAITFTNSTTGQSSVTKALAHSYINGSYSVEMWIKTSKTDSTLWIYPVSPWAYANTTVTGKFSYSHVDGSPLASTTTVTNNAWHHVVCTHDGATRQIKIYVDGTLEGTATAPTNTFSSSVNLSVSESRSNSFAMNGSADEFAFYDKVLTLTDVQEHYAAGSTAPSHGGYTAQAMNANAAMGDAVGSGNIQTLSVTDDQYVRSDTGVGSASQTEVQIRFASLTGSATDTGESRALFKTTAPSGSDFETARTFTFTAASSRDAANIHVYRLTSSWTEASVTFGTRPTETYVKTVSLPALTAGTQYTIDITGADSGHGFALALAEPYDTSVAFTIHSSEASNTAQRPYVVLATGPAQDASHTAAPMTADATLANASVATVGNAHHGAQVMAASAYMPTATTSGEQFVDVSLAAEPMHAHATWPTSTGFTVNPVVNAEPFEASVETPDAAVSVQRGPKIAAEPMTATAVWKQPSGVNGNAITASEVDDKFFQRVWNTVPSVWYRLNDLGSEAVNRMNLNGPRGVYNGVQTGQFNAPDGRHSVYFDGTANIRQATDTALESGSRNSTLEFSFRTTKADEFIMVTTDQRAGSNFSTAVAPRELFLSNGRIGYRYYEFTSGGGIGNPTEFKGTRNLADGQWHTVVIRSIDIAGPGDDLVDGVEIYIDGKFEVRRRLSAYGNGWTGFPDYIGSRPDVVRTGPIGNIQIINMPAIPSSQNFVGDMSEVVFINDALTAHEISRHYYDFMGWTPIEAEPLEAFAFTPAEARGRGNQKRALYLWWDAPQDFYSVAGDYEGVHNTMNFDPVLGGHGNYGNYDLEGYKVFSRSVTMQPFTNQPYRDAVYDQPSLIDLDTDVDMGDYDVIMFGDWPDEGWEDDSLKARMPNYATDKERLIRQLRDANEQGVGLFVTHPRLAVDLGIIDRVEYVPTLKESKSLLGGQGNAGGLYDYGSAIKFPWNITADANLSQQFGLNKGGEAMNTDPGYLAYKAYFYEDMNFNNKFRVRALVDGLTTIPSYMIKDAVYHVDFDMWGDDFGALNLIDRREGLQIGDEFIFHGTNPAGLDFYWGTDDGFRAGRPYGYYATPVANVKAGTVVTTFGETHYKDQSNVANPYKDYATTIVLDRGDVLAGRAVGGRIFVNFTEQPNRFELSLPIDITPGSTYDDGTAAWPGNGYDTETNAQRDWEYSGTRVIVGNTNIGGRIVETTVTMPDGSVVTARGGASGTLVSANYSKLFGTAYVPRWDMTRRGLWWVGRGEKPQEGEKRVAATPITATAAMAEPVVTAQRDAGYVAQPMRALAQMPRVAESTVGDAEVTTLPMTATATFTGFSRVISAEPMLAEAELVENFDMVHATGEQVVLTLHGVDATLYLKEEN